MKRSRINQRRDKQRRSVHPVQPPGKHMPLYPSHPEAIPRDEVEQKIWGRSHGQCEITILTGCRRRATDLHHRQAQGRVDTVANLVHLCNEDHLHRVHAFPEWAREVGLIIPRSANLPVVEWKFGVTMPRHPMLGG